ncbi:MAG: DUF3488 domain-containing transglutaminase family protein [Candidatus Accumulibacter sp.]|nr:DUF3488 domain-containing transglutaminase family protein [Accumulibacter sp.]
MKRPAPVAIEHEAIPWLLAAALGTVAPHMAHLPGWLTFLVGVILVWRGWLWQRRRSLPRRGWLVLLVVGSLAAITWQFRTLFGKDAGVALLVVFMALKLLEMASRRDAVVVVILGYFLLLTHYFYSQSVVTGLWLLTMVTCLTATLLRLYGGGQPPLSLVRQAGWMLAQAMPLMLILYLLFPRVTGPLWGLPQDAYTGVSGLADHLAPGSISRLIQSGAIAFRSHFADDRPQQADLYWRGPVFDSFDGQTWRAHARPSTVTDQPPQIESYGKTYAYSTLLEAHNQRWLLALDLPTVLPVASRLMPTLEVLATDPVRLRNRFSFVSTTNFRVNRVETPAILDESLVLPPTVNPRTRALAAEWRSRSPGKIVEAALALFRQENFRYTLQPPLLGGDGIDQFLFDTRQGFCEHYASAFVFLMRAAGVPSRVVAGYQGGEINPVDGYLTVRQSDAHAWAEVWIEGQGWLRIDPTAAVAPSRVEQGIVAALPAAEPLPVLVRIDTDWLRDWRNRWEAANSTWNLWVLGYNPQRQREVLSRLGWPDADWRAMSGALAVLCVVVLGVVAWLTRPATQRPDPAQRAWRRFCNELQRRGVRRSEWEGPLAFAERVAGEQPALATVTREAAGYYATLRYGRQVDDELRRLQQCRQRLPPRRRCEL